MNFNEIVVKESPGLCRCCLSEGCYKDLSSEYTWMNESEVYADMLLECFDISISQQNEGPDGSQRLVCEVCITRLRDACNFKKQVMDSEKKFVDMLGRGEFRPKVVVYQSDMKVEENAEVMASDNEAEVEYLEDDADYVTELLKTENSMFEEATRQEMPAKAKRGRPRKNPSSKPEKKTKVVKASKSDVRIKKAIKDDRPDPACTSVRRRNNMSILFNTTSIIPFKWRGRCICFYCGKQISEYGVFRKHTKSHILLSAKDFKNVKATIEIKIDVSKITCEICFETFSTFAEVISHLIGKHEMDYDVDVFMPFQAYRLSDRRCLVCEEKFEYFGSLVSHMNHFHPENTLICDYCNFKFNKKRDMANHIRRYHRSGEFVCEVCSQCFESFNALDLHKKSNHPRKCKYCSVTVPSDILMKKHVKQEHPDGGSIKCPHCSAECSSTQSLTYHLKKCGPYLLKFTKIWGAGEEPEETLKPKKKQNVHQIRLNIQTVLNMSTVLPFNYFSKFGCFYCAKKFVEIDDLRQHSHSEHLYCDIESKSLRRCKGDRITIKVDASSPTCKVCCESFESLDELIDHLILVHGVNYDKSIRCFEVYKISNDSVSCPVCSEEFRYFGSLLRHVNSEHSNNNRICNFCGKSFKNAGNLHIHISYNHLGTCQCSDCGAKFKNQSCLSRHRATAHNATEYKCPKCAEKFKSNYQMSKHLIIVHNVGHKCSYCGKMFTRNSFMKNHIRRTHLKEKNVPCGVCNDKFFDKYLLKMHMVKHDGDRKFSCDVCRKSFLRRSNLRSHMDIHKKYGHVQSSR